MATFILATIDHHKEEGSRWTETEVNTEEFEVLFLSASLFARLYGSQWCGVFAGDTNVYLCDVTLYRPEGRVHVALH